MSIVVTPHGRIVVKAAQMSMFGVGDRKPVAEPGSRGGRVYQTEQGTLRYGERPAGGHQRSTPYGTLVGRDVSVIGGEHAGKSGRAVAASPSHLHVRTDDGKHIRVRHAHAREQLSLMPRR